MIDKILQLYDKSSFHSNDQICINDCTYLLHEFIKDSIIFYIPHMPHLHRSIWYEENLFIIFPSDKREIIHVENCGVYKNIYLALSDSINNEVRKILCDFILVDYNEKISIPNYFCINGNIFAQKLKLLPFI